MPTVARRTEEETRRAWDEYAASLQGLEGAAYEDAEREAWTRLQDKLSAEAESDSSIARGTVG
jgi:hypothetical protein